MDSYFSVVLSVHSHMKLNIVKGEGEMESKIEKHKRKEGVQLFVNKSLELEVRTIKHEDGSISVNAEDAAIGFGWTRVKNNKIYIMWDRVNGFMEELNFPHKCGKDDYIPESLFYLLGMKANNDKAQEFQRWLAVDVIPEIRKTGSYKNKPMSPLEMLELQFQVIKEQEQKLNEVDDKVEDLKENMPLFNIECKEVQAAVRKKGIETLGGKTSAAYKNNSLRGKVYSDIQHQLRREFGVNKYEAIKRSQLEKAKEIISIYRVPIILKSEIEMMNNQMQFED